MPPNGPPADAADLVLGARSLIGRRLLPRLAGGSRPVLALSRGAPPEAGGAGSPRWIRGDLSAPEGLAPPVRLDAVYSLSPIWLLPGALPILAAHGARRVVAVSSTSRFGKASSPVEAERVLARRLAEAEAAAVAGAAATGLHLTLLRPTLIYLEGEDANVSRLAALVRRWRVLPLSGRGRGLRQPVHADDLAWAVLAVRDAPATFGRAYDLPGGETLSYRAMAERLFEAQGLPPRILSLPPAVWALGLRLAAPVLKGASVGMGARMEEDLAFDAAPAERDFGWRPRPFRPRFPRPAARG